MQQNKSENVVCKMAAILCQFQYMLSACDLPPEQFDVGMSLH